MPGTKQQPPTAEGEGESGSPDPASPPPSTPTGRHHDQAVLKETFSTDKDASLHSSHAPNFDDSEKDDASSRHSLEEGPDPRLPIARTVSDVRDGIESRRDIDLEPESAEAKARSIAESVHDPYLVSWDGPSDPVNPKNWPKKRKWAIVLSVSFFTLISPVSSSMIAPALAAIGAELAIPSVIEQALSLSIFVLAYAVGPLVIGPLSELYGRVGVLQLANLVYLVFNLGCGLARTREQMIAFRFLSGLGGSAPLAIGGGVLGDLFTAEERGRAMSVYSLAPLLGPAIGPLAGAYIAEYSSWRWIFHATTIADALIQVAGIFLLRETYAPVLLARKKKALLAASPRAPYHTPFDSDDRTIPQTLRRALVRPFRLLFTQPILQVLALYMM
jgi:multidrug resistance protein